MNLGRGGAAGEVSLGGVISRFTISDRPDLRAGGGAGGRPRREVECVISDWDLAFVGGGGGGARRLLPFDGGGGGGTGA